MFIVMLVFVVLNFIFCVSTAGILRWMSAAIFSFFVLRFFWTVIS